MVGKMEARVIGLEESLEGVTTGMTEIESRVEAKFLQAEERQLAFERKMEKQFAEAEVRRTMAEQKIENNLSKLSEDMKLLIQGMGVMGSASKGSTSSERTIADKGKGIMDEEQAHEEKSEVKTNPVTNEGFGVPCAPNQREIPLFDMRLRKLEVPIFKGEEEENVDGWLHRVERYFVVCCGSLLVGRGVGLVSVERCSTED